jgi:hypothetical protein
LSNVTGFELPQRLEPGAQIVHDELRLFPRQQATAATGSTLLFAVGRTLLHLQ